MNQKYERVFLSRIDDLSEVVVDVQNVLALISRTVRRNDTCTIRIVGDSGLRHNIGIDLNLFRGHWTGWIVRIYCSRGGGSGCRFVSESEYIRDGGCLSVEAKPAPEGVSLGCRIRRDISFDSNLGGCGTKDQTLKQLGIHELAIDGLDNAKKEEQGEASRCGENPRR